MTITDLQDLTMEFFSMVPLTRQVRTGLRRSGGNKESFDFAKWEIIIATSTCKMELANGNQTQKKAYLHIITAVVHSLCKGSHNILRRCH